MLSVSLLLLLLFLLFVVGYFSGKFIYHVKGSTHTPEIVMYRWHLTPDTTQLHFVRWQHMFVYVSVCMCVCVRKCIFVCEQVLCKFIESLEMLIYSNNCYILHTFRVFLFDLRAFLVYLKNGDKHILWLTVEVYFYLFGQVLAN